MDYLIPTLDQRNSPPPFDYQEDAWEIPEDDAPSLDGTKENDSAPAGPSGLLTKERERELIREWQQNKNHEARTELVEDFQPLIRGIASGSWPPSDELKERIQLGNVGFLRSIDKFDPALGYRLATLAQYWIRAFINEGVKKSHSIVHRPRGVSVVADQSLNVPANDDDPEGAERLSVLPDEGDPGNDPSETDPEAEALQDRASILIKRAIPTLDDRQRRIIEDRWLSGKNTKLSELGQEFGVSRERARQIEESAFKKFRKVSEEGGEQFSARGMVLAEFVKGNRLSRSHHRFPTLEQLSPDQNRARLAKEDSR